MTQKQRVLSGVRATGRMHLGNYLGAIQQFVQLSLDPSKSCMFFVADLHTITTRQDPVALRADRRGVVLDFLAAGLNPNNAVLFTQSSVPETCELAWILSCITPASQLERMHHWKEKKLDLESHGEAANAGLFIYPVLMAADILGPLAEVVPVGDDQRQHVELARELARRFNQRYGDLFPEPAERVLTSRRVPSLAGDGKMGKSDEEGAIALDIKPDVLWERLRVAPTDPARARRTDRGNPDMCNIGKLHGFLSTNEELMRIRNGCMYASIGCIDCKQSLYGSMEQMLGPMREHRADLLARGPAYIDEILHEGGVKARAIIKETVDCAKDLVGIPTAIRSTGV